MSRTPGDNDPTHPRPDETDSAAGPLAALLPSQADPARHILDIAGVVLVALAADGSIAMINRRGCELLGYSEQEMLGLDWFETMVPERFRDSVRSAFDLIMAGDLEPVKSYDNPVVDRRGTEHEVTWSNTLLKDQGGAILGTLSSGLDVTERRHALQAQLESEESFRALVENARDAILIVGGSGRILYVNQRAAEVAGYGPGELSDQPATDLVWPDDRHTVEHHLRAHLEGRSAPFQFECHLRSPEGEAIPVEISSSTTRWRGRRAALAIIHDISEHTTRRERLERRLREKETLLTEVHHRVKNNLQIVSGLLEIQADSFSRPEDRQRILDMHRRVESMALVHEQLHQATDLGQVDGCVFLSAVARHQHDAFAGADQRVALHLDLEPIPLSVDAAVPCGLLVGELVSNAIKHAFPADHRGPTAIHVELRGEDRHLELSVRDSGRGLPAEISPSTSPSLGLQLVDSLVNQLAGSLHIERQSGTAVTIRFPS